MKSSSGVAIPSRQVASASYFVAFLLIVIPTFDSLMQVAPFRPSAAQWRFAAVGLLSNALMIPAVGVLLALYTSLTFDDEKVRRTIRIVSWIMVVVLIAATGFFALDSVQTRSAIRPEMQLSFLVASITAAVKLLLGVVGFALFGRASRQLRQPDSKRGSAILVAREVSGAARQSDPGTA
ncbi:MAG: hypothetical protein ABJA80_02780 [bacterium]